MSYAQPQDAIDRIDVRRWGDLVLDNGVRATANQLLTNTRLIAVLNDASGLIDAALLRGGRYAPTDLQTLATTTNNGWYLLLRINVDIAYALALEARGYSESEIGSMAPGYAKALEYLDRLMEGQWIFGLAPVVAAGGVPKVVPLSNNITLLTQAARRYFGGLNYDRENPFSNWNGN
jgi:phage gp36-like protein